mmetsp:Transcript_56285/g.103307  ORF Transcript_56285/g.103307 Transcript_56285/m.103307 type:complete len:288 (-) Transcript_56285:58-921(-)
MARWWEADQPLQRVAVHLDGLSIGSFANTSRFVSLQMHNPATVRWLAEARGLADLEEISSVEHIAMREALDEFSLEECSIFFRSKQTDIDAEDLPRIGRYAALMMRHIPLTILIEGHCGLEPPSREEARRISALRASSVCNALVAHGVARKRMKMRSWGNSRPLVWEHGEPMGSPNRRVEVFFRHGTFQGPKRRSLSNYAVAPGSPLLSERLRDQREDHDDNGGRSSDDDLAMVVVNQDGGHGSGQWVLPGHRLPQFDFEEHGHQLDMIARLYHEEVPPSDEEEEDD